MMVMYKGSLHKVRGEANRRGVPHVVIRAADGNDTLVTREVAMLGALAATRHFEMMAQREADALITRAMQR